MSTIAWTGHRPKDLGRFTENTLRDALTMLRVHERKDLRFVTGGALGIDSWAAEFALDFDIPLTLILPFPAVVMMQRWMPQDCVRLRQHIERASEVRILADDFSFQGYQRRNEHMVDEADVVFAVWNGKRNGGTWNCLCYACRLAKKPVYNLWPGDGKLHPLSI